MAAERKGMSKDGSDDVVASLSKMASDIRLLCSVQTGLLTHGGWACRLLGGRGSPEAQGGPGSQGFQAARHTQSLETLGGPGGQGGL